MCLQLLKLGAFQKKIGAQGVIFALQFRRLRGKTNFQNFLFEFFIQFVPRTSFQAENRFSLIWGKNPLEKCTNKKVLTDCQTGISKQKSWAKYPLLCAIYTKVLVPAAEPG